MDGDIPKCLMNPRFFDSIDWSMPWLAALLPAAAPVIGASDWRTEINALALRIGLRNHRGLPVRFVHQAELPPGAAYEAFISATGNVPTRENLHDFLNALVWLTYPKVKVQLNRLQANEIARAIAAPSPSNVTAGSRRKLRDAATIFDENAALLISSDMKLVTALREHRWQEVFVARRSAFVSTCNVFLFGHALVEKLISPYKAITAHAWVVAADEEFFKLTMQDKRDWIDGRVTQQIANGLRVADFTHIPVLGVPGWWHGQDENFYTDATVFRPKRFTALE
jgi:hypothetical protein